LPNKKLIPLVLINFFVLIKLVEKNLFFLPEREEGRSREIDNNKKTSKIN